MDDGELVATKPRHGIAVLRATPQPLGQQPQHGVAGRVAKRIVEALEAVEIDEEQHYAAAGAAIFGHRRVEALAK